MGTTFHDERIRKILAKNVRSFLVMLEMSENALSQKCKLSQKQVNNITQARTGCGIDALVEMAGVFGCEPWMLLVNEISRHPSLFRRLGRIVSRYLTANDSDQDLIDALVAKAGAAAA